MTRPTLLVAPKQLNVPLPQEELKISHCCCLVFPRRLKWDWMNGFWETEAHTWACSLIGNTIFYTELSTLASYRCSLQLTWPLYLLKVHVTGLLYIEGCLFRHLISGSVGRNRVNHNLFSPPLHCAIQLQKLRLYSGIEKIQIFWPWLIDSIPCCIRVFRVRHWYINSSSVYVG